MSYKIEKETGDLVIGGWPSGIGSSPHNGLGDLKCLNISTMPGEVSINYARTQQTQKPISGATLSAGGTGFVVYSGSPALSRGTWITVSGSTISGLSNGVYYVLLNASSVNIQLSTTYEGSQLTGLGLTGTATFTTFNMGQPIQWASTNISSYPAQEYYVLDATGLVWKTPPGETGASQSGLGTWSLIDYTPVPNASTKSGLFIYGSYIFVVSDALYYKPLNSLGHATVWTSFKSTKLNGGHYHMATVGVDGNAYICDGGIDELKTVSGQTFDPTNTATYTWSPQALEIPNIDEATCLAQVSISGGINLIVGGLSNVLYLWVPISSSGVTSSGFTPIFLPENFTQQLVTVNNLIYVFAGSKGNIYLTNGSSITTAMTIPDYVANNTGLDQDPFYSWGGTMYVRGRIWFSAKAPNCGGIWSFIPTINYYPEQDVGLSLRLEHQNSYGTYNGMATVLFSSQAPTDQQAEGVQYYAGWDDGTSGGSSNPYGIDFSGTTPYTNGATIIETDLIPTGTMLKEQTFGQIEYKLSAPLSSITATVPIAKGATSATLTSNWVGTTGTQTVTFSDGETRTATFTNGATTMTWSGGLINTVTVIVLTETVTIKWRTALNMAWNTTGADMLMNPSNTAGYFVPDFEFTQWIQLQTTLQSTTNNPSYIRFKEIRIRQ